MKEELVKARSDISAGVDTNSHDDDDSFHDCMSDEDSDYNSIGIGAV